MRYDRKIKYLDYCENGEKIRGSGFVKTEIFGDSFKMELTVKGVRGVGEFNGDVILRGNGREEVLGKIQLMEGQGEFRHICHINTEDGAIGGTGIGCDELSGIKIPLGEGREITCIWGGAGQPLKPPKEQSAEPSAGQSEQSAKPPVEQPSKLSVKRQEKAGKKERGIPVPHAKEAAPRHAAKVQDFKELEGKHLGERAQDFRESEGKHLGERTQDFREPEEKDLVEKAQAFREPEEKYPREKQQELEETEIAAPREASPRSNSQEQQPEAVPLLENKWLQLCAIYPHINPFRDQREYLSIGPEDFVLFSSESYKAASNSFMLHGYYNYRHLILTREERRGEVLYYVGVPGNYYDHEKQVAIMFGFESFECAQEPAQSSDFGYYMMRVQL